MHSHPIGMLNIGNVMKCKQLIGVIGSYSLSYIKILAFVILHIYEY
jgi:hypothetical protein